MKSKAKLNKIKAAKNAPTDKVPANWFFMSRKEGLTVSDLKAALDEAGTYDLQLWPEAGVLEVVLEEKSSLDIETAELPFGDEFSDAFVKEHGIQTAFYLSLNPESYEKGKKIFKILIGACEGIVCGDTEDFSPLIK